MFLSSKFAIRRERGSDIASSINTNLAPLSNERDPYEHHVRVHAGVDAPQYYLEGIMCAERRNNAGRDKNNSARISSVSSVPSASVGPLPGRRLTVPESENVPWLDALGLLAWLSAIALDCEAIPGKFPTRYVSRIPTVQEATDLRALS